MIVWDIETVPDLAGFAAANGHDGKSDEEIRAGRELPKHIFQPIPPIRRFESGATGVLSSIIFPLPDKEAV